MSDAIIATLIYVAGISLGFNVILLLKWAKLREQVSDVIDMEEDHP